MHEILNPCPLSLVLDRENLYCQILPNEAFGIIHASTLSTSTQLSTKVPGLIPHDMIGVDPLPQRDVRTTNANSRHRLTCVNKSIDARQFWKISRAARTESQN